jgi:hypothetical protein
VLTVVALLSLFSPLIHILWVKYRTRSKAAA